MGGGGVCAEMRGKGAAFYLQVELNDVIDMVLYRYLGYYWRQVIERFRRLHFEVHFLIGLLLLEVYTW